MKLPTLAGIVQYIIMQMNGTQEAWKLTGLLIQLSTLEKPFMTVTFFLRCHAPDDILQSSTYSIYISRT